MEGEAFYLSAMLEAKGVSPRILRGLVERAGSARNLWDNLSDFSFGDDNKIRKSLLAIKDGKPSLPDEISEACEKNKISVMTIDDDDYPPILKEIYNPPLTIFFRGSIWPNISRIAMVGSRKASNYGKRAAGDIAETVAASNLTVVSGAARGIDTASHVGAMRSGRTVAVLGCGVDVAYPPDNKALIDEIAENGAVISEYPPGTQPLAQFFPARNRIISGLSVGVVVVEAARHSGSLITAELALSNGRDVFAVPGSIYSPTSAGCNHLIKQGAKLIESASDVLDEYGIGIGSADKASSKRKKIDDGQVESFLSDEERAVYDVLSYDEAQTVDEIIYGLHGNGAASNVAFILLQMQLKGVVVEDENHAYVRA